MNNQITEIKSEQKNWFNKGIALLAVMLISLLLALFPFISDVNIELQIFLHLFGGILFLVFATLFAILLYFEINPKTAIKFTNRGFIDIINIGENIEIEWTNISAVKVLGKENIKFLGITLENPDIVIAQMKKNKAAEIIENIEQNLPTILIPQNTVRIAIKELKSIIVKSVKDARLLESEAPKKAKTNPFTTEDVLRAFGQLPKEDPAVAEEPNYTSESEEPETVVEENNDIINRDVNEEEIDIINESELTEEIFTREATDSTETSKNVEIPNINIIEPTTNKEATADDDDVEIIISNNKVSQPFSIPEEIKPTNTTANYVSASDTFYEALRAKTIVKKEAAESNLKSESAHTGYATNSTNESDNSEMSTEIEELLSKARSSKITEIEKLLSDDDIPFSVVREKKEEVPADENEVNLEPTDDTPIAIDDATPDKPQEKAADASVQEEYDCENVANSTEIPEEITHEEITINCERSEKDCADTDIEDEITEQETETETDTQADIEIDLINDNHTNTDDVKSFEINLESLIESANKSCDDEMEKLKIENVFPVTNDNAVTKEFNFDLSKAFEENE